MMRFLFLILFLFFGKLPALAEDGYKTFDRVWNLVEEKFYDPGLSGLDSQSVRAEAKQSLEGVTDPEEVARIVNGFLDRLNASHTRLFSAREPDYYELLDVFFSFENHQKGIRKRFQGAAPHYHGILVYERDGAVVDVVPGGPADQAGLRKGDRILTADREPYHPIDSFRGKAGKPVQLTVSRGADTLDIVVHPEDVYPRQAFLRSVRESARIIEDDLYDIGYVRMWSYAGEIYHEELEKVLGDKLAGTDGLLLDLRGRWGGAQPQYVQLFSPTPKLEFTDQNSETFETDVEVWNKPVGLVIDSTVSSGKEILAYAFLKSSLGPLIGERTQGSVLGGSLHLLPGDYALYLATVDVRTDGQRLEGLGVGPTHDQEDPTAESAARALTYEMFKRDVVRRANLDQSARLRPSAWSVCAAIDEENTEWAKRVVESVGWPKESRVGKEAAHLFWLIVQHSPDVKFKERCLELMTEAVEEGEASVKDLAYLYDRVQMNNQLPQRYGTQLFGRDNQYGLWMLEDPDNLDARREQVGLPPIREYLKYFQLDGYENLEDVIYRP